MITQRSQFIFHVIRQMRELGHGGTLLIVPDDEAWKRSIQSPILYQSTARFTEITETIEELEKPIEGESMFTSLWTILEGYEKPVALLTAVDGVTIISQSLNVIAFGAKIKEGSHNFQIYEIDPRDPEYQPKTIDVEDLGGKRHQSAARFVFQERDSLALVVSQDGHVTCFVWEEADADQPAGLCAHRRLELTYF